MTDQHTSIKFLSVVGSGSYGKVFAACVNGDKCYAVKRMKIKQLPEAITEVAILTSFRHPNLLCTMFEPIIGQKHLDVILPLAATDLRRYIRLQGPLRGGQRLHWPKQLCEATLALQHHDIIHGDMKPANVMVFPDLDRIMLGDFTMAIQKPRRTSMFRHRATTLTHRAPEALMADLSPTHAWDERADDYGLGCILYEMAVGHAPFPGLVGGADNEEGRVIQLRQQILFAISNGDESSTQSFIDAVGSPDADTPIPGHTSAIQEERMRDLVKKLLRLQVTIRYTAARAVAHPVFTEFQDTRPGYSFVTTQLAAAAAQPINIPGLTRECARLNVDEAVAQDLCVRLGPLLIQQTPKEAISSCVYVAGILSGREVRRPSQRRVEGVLEVLKSTKFRVLRKEAFGC